MFCFYSCSKYQEIIFFSFFHCLRNFCKDSLVGFFCNLRSQRWDLLGLISRAFPLTQYHSFLEIETFEFWRFETAESCSYHTTYHTSSSFLLLFHNHFQIHWTLLGDGCYWISNSNYNCIKLGKIWGYRYGQLQCLYDVDPECYER